MELHNARTKVILLVHFILVSLTLQGGWTPSSCGFYNLLVCLLLLWAIIDRTSDEPYFMVFYAEVLCIFFDLFILLFHSPLFKHNYFSTTCLLVNAVFRGYVIYSAAVLHAERLGRADAEKWSLMGVGRAEQAIRRRMEGGSADGTQQRARSEYEDVDNTTGPAPYSVDPIFDAPQQPPAYSQIHKPPPHDV